MARAREVGAQAALLHDEDALAGFADPPPEVLAVADELFGWWFGVKADTAEDAARAINDMAARLAIPEDPEPGAG